jgi:hypothetical protein
MKWTSWRAAPVAGLACALFAGGVALAQDGPERARNLVLCHGESPPPCELDEQWSETYGEHPVTVVVTDAAGGPVADVPVELREQGEGHFTSGDDSVLVTTGAFGQATATLTAEDPGESQVTAEISPFGIPGGFRGAGTADDACEQPAGPGGDPPAGNCTAGPLVLHWEEPPPVVDVRVARVTTLAFGHSSFERMVVFGRVKLTSGGPHECVEGVPVTIALRSGGKWNRLTTVTTSREGWYVAAIADRPGLYRATATVYSAGFQDDAYAVCRRARRAKNHRHDG